jgi:hypothetical protein
VAGGAASTLTWSSTNATSCTASGDWSGTKATSGNQSTAAVAATTSYSLTCSGTGGTSNVATATVTVGPLPTVALTANPTSVAGGAASTLTWSSTNATACTATGGWSGTKGTSGTQSTGAVTVTTSYSLTCSGTGGTSNVATATVTVVPAPTVTLTANPTAIAGGGTSTLTWSSTNATSCTATGGWTGTKGTSGTQSTGAITMPSSYSLTCTGTGGTSGASTVLVNIIPTATLVATPSVIASGGTSTLTWSSTNATSCTATGGWSGAKATSGTQSTGALTATTSYSLSCSGAGGPSSLVTATVTISSGTVTVAPKIAALAVSQTQQFTAAVPGGGAATWAVDGIAGGNAVVGVVTSGGTSGGLYTAGTAVGTHTVVATSVANPTQSGSAVVAVTDLAGMYTYHNDLARDGANMQEYALTTANVNTSSFGKLTSCTVDGAIYGQPLWVANLTVSGAKHNVVFVATEHDSLYAFDADAVPCQQLWTVSLIDAAHGGLAGESTVPPNLFGAGEGAIAPEVGVTSTPVIDPVSGLLYAVSMSVNSAHTTYYHRLHALTLATGAEKTGSPMTVVGTFPLAAGGTVSFDPHQHLQRSGLALVNGVVYLAFASQEDAGTWYGWMMGYQYSGTALTQTAVFNATPNAKDGGIWMSGGAPAVDSTNNLYVLTGNGGFDATSTTAPNNDYGDSLLKLTSSLTVSQWFTPTDQQMDDLTDSDFGSGGAAILADLPAGSPVTHLLMCGGKDGALYVLNRDLLGGYDDSHAVQKIAFGAQIFATGAFWNNKFYLGGLSAPLRAYQLTPSMTPLFALGSSSSHSFVFPGSTPSVSAAATQNGIVWALDTSQYCTSQSPGCAPAVLYAYDASNLATELWNSSTVTADAAGFAVKFAVPTIANGKVYVGTRGNNTGVGTTSVSGELDIYGLKP